MNQPFHYYLRVRYSECDGQKIVFNSRYGEYVDLGTSEFVRALDFDEDMISGDLDYRLVKQTTEWLAPAQFDQVLELSIIPNHFGNTSFGILTEIRIAGKQDVITRVETIYVLIDGKTFKKKPLTEKMKRELQSSAKNKIVDHAAYLSTNV